MVGLESGGEEERASDLGWVLRCGHLLLLLPDEPLQLGQGPNALILVVVVFFSLNIATIVIQMFQIGMRCDGFTSIFETYYTISHRNLPLLKLNLLLRNFTGLMVKASGRV